MVLTNRRIAVFGVANDKSICWAIVEKLLQHGLAEVVLVSHPTNEKRVKALASTKKIDHVVLCDVTSDSNLDACFKELAQIGTFDGALHGIAFSDKEQLKGRFLDVTRDNFLMTLNISSYSLIEIARRMEPLMPNGGSILALTFDASRGTYPHYNAMGVAKGALETIVRYAASDLGEKKIRLNALSPSPEDTLSARGISNFRRIGDFAEAMSPFGRRADLEEVGNWGAFLLSSMSSGMTGQVILVDCGASSSIMPPVRNAAKMALGMLKIVSVNPKAKPEEREYAKKMLAIWPKEKEEDA